jgi:hypothetical protein
MKLSRLSLTKNCTKSILLLSVASQVIETTSFTILPLSGDMIVTSGADLSPLSLSQDENMSKQINIVIFLMLKIYIKKNYNIDI